MAHLIGHRENALVAFDGSRHGQSHSGIAAGAFDDSSAGKDDTAFFSVFDQVPADPVLDRTSGIEGFDFSKNIRRAPLRDPVQSDDRRIPDGLKHVLMNHGAVLAG